MMLLVFLVLLESCAYSFVLSRFGKFSVKLRLSIFDIVSDEKIPSDLKKKFLEKELQLLQSQNEKENELQLLRSEKENELKLSEKENELKLSEKENELKLLQSQKENELKLLQSQKENELQSLRNEMEILKMDHDKKLVELNTSLEKSFSTINCLAPRAVIEYAENFKMDASYKSLNREDKWTKFLTDTEEGRHITGCLLQNNKGWNGGAKDIAKRIQGIYQFTSDNYHATSHSIAAKDIVVFDKLAYSIQIYNAIVCIAKSLDIQYEDKNKT